MLLREHKVIRKQADITYPAQVVARLRVDQSHSKMDDRITFLQADHHSPF